MKEKKEKAKSKKKEELSEVQEVRKQEITFNCPVRGLVTQTVDVKVYPKVKAHATDLAEELEIFLKQEGIIADD